MRLFLSDTFFDAVLRLPKKTQDKVVAFQKKFREDHKRLGIHLEPISQFKNSTLRTARVDDNYRMVVGVLDCDNYTLLYVADHEEAYRWGMNKRFVWNEHTQACQLITIEEKEENPKVNLPVDDQPAFFTGVAEEKLLKIGVPEDAIGRVKAIKSLDDLDLLASILPNDAFENIFNIMDGENIDVVIANIAEGQAKDGNDQLLSDNNRRRFVELTDDDDLKNIIEQGMEKWQIFLHPSQRKLVYADYKGTMKVSGGAGTGKTVAAMHRLKYLCEDPNTKILFTTYTKALSENLAGLIVKLNVPRQKYTLGNIDSILNTTAKKYNVMPDYTVLDYKEGGDKESLRLWREVLETEVTEFDEHFLYDEYIDVIVYFGNKSLKEYMVQSRIGRSKALSRKQRVEVWHLVEKYIAIKRERKLADRLEMFNETTNFLNENNIHPYTNVIADEFQDFSNPELKFLRALVAEGRNDLFLTGDPMQRIYTGKKMNFGAAGINVRGVRSKKLKINYRTTEPIRRVATNVIKGLEFDDMDGGKETTNGYVSLIQEGVEPKYVMVTDANYEIQQIIDWMNDCVKEGIKPSEICVAAPSSNLLKELQSRLHKDGTDYRVVKGGQKQGDSKGMDLCTYHSLKGLEYRVVILMGVNERNLPSKPTSGYPFVGMGKLEQKEYISSKRSLLYVAITRARQLVYMVGCGDATGMLKSSPTD